MKQKVNCYLKNQPGWMKMMKLRKSKFKFARGNYMSHSRVTVSGFDWNDPNVLCVFSPSSVDMTHKYRKDFMKSDAEKVLTKKKLKRRLEEQ